MLLCNSRKLSGSLSCVTLCGKCCLSEHAETGYLPLPQTVAQACLPACFAGRPTCFHLSSAARSICLPTIPRTLQVDSTWLQEAWPVLALAQACQTHRFTVAFFSSMSSSAFLLWPSCCGLLAVAPSSSQPPHKGFMGQLRLMPTVA